MSKEISADIMTFVLDVFGSTKFNAMQKYYSLQVLYVEMKIIFLTQLLKELSSKPIMINTIANKKELHAKMREFALFDKDLPN